MKHYLYDIHLQFKDSQNLQNYLNLTMPPPKKRRCLGIKITSEPQDQTGCTQTPSSPSFLLLAITSQSLS